MSRRSSMSSGSTQSRSATPTVARMPDPGWPAIDEGREERRSQAAPPDGRGRRPAPASSPSAVATATPTSDDPATAPTIRDPFRAAATSIDRADVTSNGLTTRASHVERRQLGGAQRGDHRRLGTDGPRRRRPSRRRRRTTSRGPRPRAAASAARPRGRGPASPATAASAAACSAPTGARRSARPRRSTASPASRTPPPRPPTGPATRSASRPAPRDAPRPATSAPTPAAPPGTRRTRRRPSRAIGRPPTGARSESTSRAASPIAVVVTRRCASGSQACVSAPCCETTTSGPNAAASVGSRARTAASHAVSPVYGSSGTLTALPAAAPSPRSSMNPVPGNRYRPLSWNDTVSTPGIGVRDRLDAVAVVRVEVDVQDAQAGGPRPDDRQRRVVVDAEPPRLGRHRVVQPAAGVEGVLDVPAQDRLHRAQRAVGDRGAGLVHARERRVVGHADAHRRPRRRVGGEPPHGLDIRGRMDGLEVRVRGRLGRRSTAPRRPPAGGRSRARTAAASAGGRGRSRTSASAGRRRGAGRQRARDDDPARVMDTFGTIPPWSACTRPPGWTSSA